MKKKGIGEKPHLKKKKGLVQVMGRPGLAGSLHGLFFNKLGPVQLPSPGSTCRDNLGLISILDTML